MKARIKAVIADDSDVMRSTVQHFVEARASVKVTGVARDGREAFQLVRQLRPDLVLMDLNMPEVNGLDATRAIKSEAGAPPIIILSLDDDPISRQSALEAGADGFCSKAAIHNLIPLIQRLLPEKVAPKSRRPPSRPQKT